MQKNITLLGSTGSIGKQTLDVAKQLNINIVALCAYSNVKLLEEQARNFKPQYVAVVKEDLYSDLKLRLQDTNIKILAGTESMCELAKLDSSEMVINAVMGMAGLRPTLSAIDAGKIVGLANKESLVVAGQLITKKLKFKNQLLPIDSEHSAIFQSLAGNKHQFIDKLILTASGGPFLGKNKNELKNVLVKETLNHPNWSMGRKITVDSATLMNKGLELIEACVLFDVKPKDIEILIHRESIIHSMVRYVDGSIIAQLSVPDMRLPIQYAICYPERVESNTKKLDFCEVKNLTFAKPDIETFNCLKIAIDVANKGNIYPCVLNAANEEAVDLFLSEKIKFLEIAEIVKSAVDSQTEVTNLTLEEIFDVDIKIRNLVKGMVK